MAGVWVFSEQRSTLLELVGEGRKLADRLGVGLTALVPGGRFDAVDAIAFGADEAIVLTLPEGQPLETAAEAVARLVGELDPDLILWGATLRAKGLAARVAARLGAALVTDATALRVQPDGRIETDRMVYGGGGVATQVALTRPQMIAVPPRTFAEPAVNPRIGDVREVVVPADSRVKVTERRPKSNQGADIAAAGVVVGVGRGLAAAEDLALVEALAATLGGAVGCTRPVAEDLGWLPEDRYIGISGRKVAPKVYVAVGLSGQVQHLAGMRESKVVVAINKDENAPIFANADYGLVGDLYTVLPALTDELKKLMR
ncbi:MAG TPA: electron transfer flavoprotein subunit alpha/FixB family protein [Symbiobacteriaceae bacterium]|jgi:electron transfer flavoprotein alpha subunit